MQAPAQHEAQNHRGDDRGGQSREDIAPGKIKI
jgi:hypothetical protein